MITTTLAVLALASGLDLSVLPTNPSWQKDYAQAMVRATVEGKPVAVFIGQGSDKVRQMLQDGSIPTEAAKILRDSYVCLYVDTATTEGKELAGKFEMTEGLVISSPGGKVQSYRHSGVVSKSELTVQVANYASAGQPTSTVIAGPVVVRPAAYTGGCPNGNCGNVVPAYGYVYPGTSYPFGGCANGQCPR
jgi:hypothetical protein